MGYQESYFTSMQKTGRNTYTSNNKLFDEFVSTIKSNGRDAYDAIGCYPVEIITLTTTIRDGLGRKWAPGTKFIYFCGERFPQSYANGYNGNVLLHPKCLSCESFGGHKYHNGECGPWSCRNNDCEHLYDHGQHVMFTEYMPSDSIWPDAGGKVTAIHEKFWE